LGATFPRGELQPRLRVYITGGGCSGFQYGFAFDENLQPDDCIIPTKVEDEEGNGVRKCRIVIDALSIMYLTGAIIDYTESLTGCSFTVKNPNAQTTCSCGSSFAI